MVRVVVDVIAAMVVAGLGVLRCGASDIMPDHDVSDGLVRTADGTADGTIIAVLFVSVSGRLGVYTPAITVAENGR